MVAVRFCAGAQSRHIGAGTRFAEQLAPDIFGAGHTWQQLTLRFFTGKVHDGWAAITNADHKMCVPCLIVFHFLRPHHLVQRGQPSTAVFFGPGQACEAIVRFLFVPVFSFLKSGIAFHAHVKLISAPSSVRLEPGFYVAAKGGQFWCVLKIHDVLRNLDEALADIFFPFWLGTDQTR